ncbi:hypothetical protein [Blastopirellula marina]|uniref:Uncharacterized protein n=1 Tax=Blastopirellula marina TaxID=124 RepID=A0A2S8F7Q5_9BACT|nr:hypothetical protein [Blastopirellula marina]PQO28185.1 hypothetical protein C5Y98_25105 [Blastopirellula marina]PTL41725.1 hypothetical protein C5Y97_25120 [Blastopirellula marina]
MRPEESFFLLLTCLTPLLLIGIPIWVLWVGIDNIGLGTLKKCYRGIELHETPQEGDVTFTYHTYRGILVWSTQNEHRICAPADDALKLLGRLLRYNLTMGMLSAGLVFVPFLAIGNYIAQRRSIFNQIAASANDGR